MEHGFSGYNINQMVYSKLNKPKEDTVDTKMLEKNQHKIFSILLNFLISLLPDSEKNVFILMFREVIPNNSKWGKGSFGFSGLCCLCSISFLRIILCSFSFFKLLQNYFVNWNLCFLIYKIKSVNLAFIFNYHLFTQ